MSPSVVLRRQSVAAGVEVSKPIDKVTSARIELGYHNFYRYRWAGRADSAAAAATDAMWLTESLGTTYGTDRDAKEWICVLSSELHASAGDFTGGQASFRVPSWAPPSSPHIARWSCRLVVQRAGRDVDEHAEFTVAASIDDAPSDIGPLEQISGAAAARLDIVLPRPVFRAGETIAGVIIITPTRDLPDGDVGVCWQRQRFSHPLTRTPGPDEATDGRLVQLDKRIVLREGAPVRLPFTLALPEDAAPTASAVNSSLAWFVGARMFYAGFSSLMPERVRRPIVVVNAVDV